MIAGLEGHATNNRDNTSQAIRAGSKEWSRKELSTNLRPESLPTCLQSRPVLLRLNPLLVPLSEENSTNTTSDASSATRK